MTCYSYIDFVAYLKKRGVTLEPYEPSCPKRLNFLCDAGNCAEGNRMECEQRCSFFFGNRLFFVNVIFAYKPNTQIGFINAADGCIQNIIQRGIMSKNDFKVLEQAKGL